MGIRQNEERTNVFMVFEQIKFRFLICQVLIDYTIYINANMISRGESTLMWCSLLNIIFIRKLSKLLMLYSVERSHYPYIRTIPNLKVSHVSLCGLVSSLRLDTVHKRIYDETCWNALLPGII